MQTKFESLEKFIKLSTEDSKKFFGGYVPIEDGTKTPSEYNCTYTVGGTTRTIKDSDTLYD